LASGSLENENKSKNFHPFFWERKKFREGIEKTPAQEMNESDNR